MTELPVIDQGENRGNRWFAERWFKIALLLAVAEGLLVAVDVIPAWAAIILAVLALVIYFGWARERSSAALRDGAWVVAVWQAIVLLVPILVVIVGTLALVAVGVIAVLALVALFADRR